MSIVFFRTSFSVSWKIAFCRKSNTGIAIFEIISEFENNEKNVFVNINISSSAHALGGVSGVASFITTDEQLQ